jgi:hypothetical protein
MEAKRRALDGLTATTKGYGTNSATNAQATTTVHPQVIERDGRPERARTVDLHRVNLARLQDTTTYNE